MLHGLLGLRKDRRRETISAHGKIRIFWWNKAESSHWIRSARHHGSSPIPCEGRQRRPWPYWHVCDLDRTPWVTNPLVV